MTFPRASGILLHPTSLPGPFGIGDLGDEARSFVDFLAEAGQRYWQVLPLGPTGFGDSPYQCFSAFAGNPLLVSPKRLLESNLLSDVDLENVPRFSATRVDFGRVIQFKTSILERAFANFQRIASDELRSRFLAFCNSNSWWLEDYAFFRALKFAHGGVSWASWETRYRRREPHSLAAAREELALKIEAEKFFQFLFFDQWLSIKSYARERNIRLIGDAPIFVAYDSADVWSHPQMFKLDSEGQPIVVAGVPPDYFSRTGQHWGNPIYNWDVLRANGFRWWIERLRFTLQLVDILRIDHFRGFAASWEIPGDEITAENGRWVEVPGLDLFNSVQAALGVLPIIAEDLGVITPDVVALRDGYGLPGMRIVQFGFGGDSSCGDLPHNYVRNCVAYTGTHDNDTAVGWFRSKAGQGSIRTAEQIEHERSFCRNYLNSTGREIHWDMIRAAWASVADTAIAPLQDVLGLDSRARMNLPASQKGNWQWRFRAGALTRKHSDRLKELTVLYGR